MLSFFQILCVNSEIFLISTMPLLSRHPKNVLQKMKGSLKGFLSIFTFPFTTTGVKYGNYSTGTAELHAAFLAKSKKNRALP